MKANSKKRGFFRNPRISRFTGMQALMVFCLLFAAVQPWKLPISFLEQPAMVEATSSGLGLPLNEEDNLNEKIQDSSSSKALGIVEIKDRLFGERPKNLSPFPFLEVPTPPPTRA